MMRNTAQWARYFVPCAFRRLFQQPQPRADIRIVLLVINLVVYKDREFPALSVARFGVTERVQ